MINCGNFPSIREHLHDDVLSSHLDIILPVASVYQHDGYGEYHSAAVSF